MVAGKPELGDIFEMLVFKNLPGAYVAMIIYYRHFCCVLVIKNFCGFRRKKKIAVHKRLQAVYLR